ncbi:MAG: hypothetical protein ABH874_02905 [Methanobacteriota archaeon]
MNYKKIMDFRVVKRVATGTEDIKYLDGIQGLNGKRLEALTLDDINELIEFLQSWNKMRRVDYRDDKVKRRILEDIKKCTPNFQKLEDKDLLKITLDDLNVRAIKEIFNILANSNVGKSKARKHGFTGASKIMHIILPQLFVMWDGRIREAYNCKGNAEGYIKFVQKAKVEAEELMDSWMRWKSKDELWQELGEDEITLPRILDRVNFNLFTDKNRLQIIKQNLCVH